MVERANRIVLDNNVVDHERALGSGIAPIEVVAVCPIVDISIGNVWSFSAD
jgi:hypothetical protein